MARVRWFTFESGLESLHTLTTLWKTRGLSNRIRFELPVKLRPSREWRSFILAVTKELAPGAEMNHPFVFEEPAASTLSALAWKYDARVQKTSLSEKKRGAMLGLLASIARNFMTETGLNHMEMRSRGDDKGVGQREWGRLMQWCHAMLGQSSYGREHDARRGIPPMGRGGASRGAHTRTRARAAGVQEEVVNPLAEVEVEEVEEE
jgi:hypothetical protein